MKLGCPVANGGKECVRGCGGRYRITDAAIRRAIQAGKLNTEKLCGTLQEQVRRMNVDNEQLQQIEARLKAATPAENQIDADACHIVTFHEHAKEDIISLIAEVRWLQADVRRLRDDCTTLEQALQLWGSAAAKGEKAIRVVGKLWSKLCVERHYIKLLKQRYLEVQQELAELNQYIISIDYWSDTTPPAVSDCDGLRPVDTL